MGLVIITGYSDDVITIDGDISQEFNWYSRNDEQRFIAVSDGTLLRVRYDEDGLWRFTRLMQGTAQFEHLIGDVEKDTNDVIRLTGDVRWVVMATDKAQRNAPPRPGNDTERNGGGE
jgi:hypothetical protein